MTKSKGIQKNWTDDEGAILMKGYKNGDTDKSISLNLSGRSPIAVRTRAKRIGLEKVKNKTFSIKLKRENTPDISLTYPK